MVWNIYEEPERMPRINLPSTSEWSSAQGKESLTGEGYQNALNQALLSKGWSQGDIDRVNREISGEGSPAPAKKSSKTAEPTEQDPLFEALRRRSDEWKAREALKRPQYRIPQEYTPAGGGASREAFSIGMSPTSGIYMTEAPREGFAGAFSNIGSERIREQNPYEALKMEYLVDKSFKGDKATPEQDKLWQEHFNNIYTQLMDPDMEPPTKDGKPMTEADARAIAKQEADEKFGGMRVGAKSEARKSLIDALGRQPTAKVPGDFRGRGMDIKTGEITESAYITDAAKKYRAASPEDQQRFLKNLPQMGLSERETKRLMTAIKPVKAAITAKVKKPSAQPAGLTAALKREKEKKEDMTLGAYCNATVVAGINKYISDVVATKGRKLGMFAPLPWQIANALTNTKVSDLEKTITQILSTAGLGKRMIELAWADIKEKLGEKKALAGTKPKKPLSRVLGPRG